MTAQEAREAVNLTPAAAARLLRIGERYLLKLEKRGFPFVKAELASVLYPAPLQAFLPPPSPSGSGPVKRPGKGGRQTPSSPRNAAPAPRVPEGRG